MLDQKLISPLAYANAVNTALIPYGHKVALPAATRGVAAYFTQYVERQLIARFGEARTFGGGLKVYTTIDLKMQEKARKALNTTLKKKGPAGSMVAIDPRNGRGQGARRWPRLLEAAVRHRDAGTAPAGLVLQAVRARRRARGGHPAVDDVPVAPAGDQPRQRPSVGRAQRHAPVQRLDPDLDGDDPLRQHGLRPADDARRSGIRAHDRPSDGRHEPARRDPLDRPRSAPPRRLAARDGARVRDVRERRRAHRWLGRVPRRRARRADRPVGRSDLDQEGARRERQGDREQQARSPVR